MTTVTITYNDLVQVEYVDDTYKIVSPVIESNFRAYGNYAEFVYETTTGVIDNGPAYIYLTGPAGVTAYNFPDPLDLDYNSARYFIAVGHPDLDNFGTVDTVDNIGLGNHADSVYAGPGNDNIYVVATTSTAAKYLVGGSGNDTIQASYGADILYGDFADAPVFVTNTQWQTPASADPAVVDGNDYLDGSYGPDILYGGGGDDVLIGDPDSDNSYDNQDELHGGDGNDQLMGGTAADKLFGEDDNDVLQGQRGADTLDGGDGNDMLDGGPRGSGWTDVLTGGDGADAFMLSYTPASSSDTSGDQSFWDSWGSDFVANAAGGGVFSGVTDLSTAAAKAFFESVAGSILLGGMSTAISGVVTDALGFLFHQSKSSTPQPSGEDVMVVTDFDPREDVLFLPVPAADQNNPATSLTSTPTFYSESATGANGQTGWGIEFTKGTSNTTFAEVFLAQDFLTDFGITSSNSNAALAFIDDVFANALVVDANGVQQSQQVYPFPTDPSAYTDGVVPTVADTPVPFQAPSGTITKVFGAFGPQVIVGPSVVSNNTYVAGTNMGDLAFITTSGFAPDDWDNAVVVPQVTNASLVKGYGGDDMLNGSAGEDNIDGGDGDDFIYGWNAAFAPLRDQLAGADGNDTLFAAKPLGGRAAADFDGGDGSDTVSFAYSRYSVTASLATGTGTNAGDDASQAAAYTFVAVENLTGTALADTLAGDANANVVQGNAGSDTLHGGGGSDTASYQDNPGKVVVDLAEGTTQEFDSAGNAASTDTLVGFENVIGSPFDDTLAGDANDNVLDGGAGDDVLTGNAGADRMIGGDGYDTVAFATNGTAGAGVDLAAEDSTGAAVGQWRDAFGFEDVVDRSTVEAYRGTPGNDYMVGDGGNGTNPLFAADFYGMGGDDFLAGSGLGQTLDGGDGNDQLNGLGGADTLLGGDGYDLFASTPADLDGDVIMDFTVDDVLRVLNPGTFPSSYPFGLDVVESNTTQTILAITEADGTTVLARVTLEGDLDGRFATTTDSAYTNITYTSAPPITGTDDDDELIGTDDRDTILLYAGDDTAFGRAGADKIYGGDGDDELLGGRGDDLIHGGNGNDLIAGGAGADTISGDAGNDTIRGGDGADVIDAGDGDDVVLGGLGDDILVGGPGDDVLLGDLGLDTAIFAGAFADYRITGTDSTARTVEDLVGDGGRDTLSSVELLQFDDGVFDVRTGVFDDADAPSVQLDDGAVFTAEAEVLVSAAGIATDVEPLLTPVVA